MAFWSRNKQQRNSWSISDPVLAEYFNVGNPNYAGVNVGELSSLGLSGFYRAISLIAGTVASLPMRTLRDTDDGRVRVGSVFDNPGGPEGPTPYEWTETVLTHLLMHGNAFLAHVFNGAGALAALVPIHPLGVAIELDATAPGGKLFKASLNDGSQRTFTMLDMTHIPSLTLNSDNTGRGLSLISIARNSLGTGIAGDRAAARMFGKGPLILGMVSAEEDITEDEAKAIKEGLDAKMAGVDNAGDIAVVNRKLKFSEMSMTNADAQWLESRQFQIEEVARWTGVPPHLLMQTEKQTSWGTGVAEQNRGLARFTLAPWTTRVEQRLSRLLPSPRYVEFDYAGLLQPAPEQEIALLIQQVGAGLITVNEARKIRNMDPIPGGDTLRFDPTINSEAPEADSTMRSADELLDDMDKFLRPKGYLQKGSPEAMERMAHARAAKAAKRNAA
jgi:HK97 family phage portal protein